MAKHIVMGYSFQITVPRHSAKGVYQYKLSGVNLPKHNNRYPDTYYQSTDTFAVFAFVTMLMNGGSWYVAYADLGGSATGSNKIVLCPVWIDE